MSREWSQHALVKEPDTNTEEHMKNKKLTSTRNAVEGPPTTGGITPGRVTGDFIELAKGRIASPSYRGPVSIRIDAENHGLLDLRVEHRELPDRDACGSVPADDPVFGQEVIRVLQEAGKLPPGGDFELGRAELGMQWPDLAVFESLTRAGIDVSRAAAITWGAVDQELAEEREWLFGSS